MAVKVTGTVVISDSRNLENVAREYANNIVINELVSVTPSANLHVNGTSNIRSTAIFGGNIAFDDTQSTRIWDPAANTLAFYTTQAERMRIDASGNVGIGVTAPTSNIHVIGTANITSNVLLATVGSANVFIGRTNSTIGKNVKLDIVGSVNARSYFANGVVVGATGGGTDDIFYENSQNVTTNYTITTNKNAMTTGPVTINSGVTVTVPSGSRWVVI